MEVAPFGVAVVLVEPGFVKTDINAASHRQAGDFAVAASGYQELIAKVTEYVGKQVADNGIPAETVARRIADVAEAGNPKARYVMPASGRALVSFMNALPDGAADRAKRRALGMSKAVA
jgi:NAD(P)-dependent dehydrogenase (short-subunit alcohol dehydrogenase family)